MMAWLRSERERERERKAEERDKKDKGGKQRGRKEGKSSFDSLANFSSTHELLYKLEGYPSNISFLVPT
jgi:hypothetical protein